MRKSEGEELGPVTWRGVVDERVASVRVRFGSEGVLREVRR